tara:strand:+ start:2253 stop:2441 length:189 start_codon:yes stop_codon:yes gene_type:complete
MNDSKTNILNAVDDLMGSFLYYDRKEDEDLPSGEIESSIKNNEISVDEIVEKFKTCLMDGLK